MRGIPRDRPPELGMQESLGADAFLERARAQQSGRDRAVNEETFLRNEWGTRTFGFTSLVVDPPDGRTPALNEAGRARAANGEEPPPRANGLNIYRAPSEDAEIFNINAGE
jgi:hypothetical protein